MQQTINNFKIEPPGNFKKGPRKFKKIIKWRKLSMAPESN